MMIVQYTNDSMTVKGNRKMKVSDEINKMQGLMTAMCDVKHQRNSTFSCTLMNGNGLTLAYEDVKTRQTAKLNDLLKSLNMQPISVFCQ